MKAGRATQPSTPSLWRHQSRWMPCVLLLGIAVLTGAAAGPEKGKTDADAVEEPEVEAVLLGTFKIRELREVEGATLRVAFTVYSAPPVEEAEAIRELLTTRSHRVRDAVITAVRMCEQKEFQEPGLERFRRRIWLRLHQTLPELRVERVLIGGFEFFTE